MVKLLSFHHFLGQKIAKCEESGGVVITNNFVVIALDHQVNVYPLKSTNQPGNEKRNQDIIQRTSLEGRSKSIINRPETFESDLTVINSFPTVDLIENLNYSVKGNYLLSLEKRDADSHVKNIRAYFHWEKKGTGKAMRARIAGLVSPTGSEPGGEESLTMVEIPLSRQIINVGPCNNTGNIAVLSENIVDIFIFKMKEGTGRIKVQYADFDHAYSIELTKAFIPTSISFLEDFVALMNSLTVLVFRVNKNSHNQRDSYVPPLPTSPPPKEPQQSPTDRVVFNPKDESIKVYLNSIMKENRRSKYLSTKVVEEIQEEIVNGKTVFKEASLIPNSSLEDLIRLNFQGSATESGFIQIGLQPLIVKGIFRGCSLIAGITSEAFVYYFPLGSKNSVCRIISFPFTSSLVSLSFDSYFLHFLTESGLETYTSRNLYHPLRDYEGFSKHINDCPFEEEEPSLVGIRPFLGIRFLAGNDSSMCLLASPSEPPQASETSEDNQWTIYLLRNPNIEVLIQDGKKAVELHKKSNSESYLVILSELHLLLRIHMNLNPGEEKKYLTEYRLICRKMGEELIRSSGKVMEDSGKSDDLMNRGVTYLIMANCDLTFIFAPENVALYTKDPQLVRGIVRFVEILLSKQSLSSKTSPNLAKQIVEFLSANSPDTLVKQVIKVPILRECNSALLLKILKDLTEKKKYRKEETLAFLLTIVTMNGCTTTGRALVKELISKCKKKDLEQLIDTHILLDLKGKPTLTDLGVCLSSARAHVVSDVLTIGLKKSETGIGEIMIAFAQAVNLNSDIEVQKSLTKSLSSILENYLCEKMTSQGLEKEITASLLPPNLTDDEVRAVHTLIRSYLSHISFNLQFQEGRAENEGPVIGQDGIKENHSHQISRPNSGEEKSSILKIESGPVILQEQSFGEFLTLELFIDHRYHLFGRIPSFISVMVKGFHVEHPILSPTGHNIGPELSAVEESREYFVKLSSLLGSKLVNIRGVKDLVKDFLDKKGSQSSPIHNTLKMLVESTESVIANLILRYPTALMLYAKEMFGKSTLKWKKLVAKLKEKIISNSDDMEVFTTIIESVYLHLANTLSPTELEEVLDKGEEQNAKFHSACKRIELANQYANILVDVSNEYLQH